MNQLEQAAALHRSGRLAEAQALYRAALAANPNDAQARQLLGVVLAQQGRPEDGLAEIDAALRLKPDHAEADRNRALVHRMLGRNDEAVAGFSRALARDPNQPQIWNSRGAALQDMKRPAEALADFDQALRLAPHLSQAHNNRGSALLDLGRAAEALEAFDAALARAPNDAVVHNNRANALLLLGRTHEAVAGYDRALALKPDYAEALANRGGTYHELKQYGAALADHEAALIRDSTLTSAFTGAAMAALNLCDFARAEKYLAEMPDWVRAGKPVAPWILLAHSDDEALQLQCARNAIAARFPAAPPPAPQRYRHDKLRLGYLSSDFGAHPVTRQLARLIELHDRARFTVTAYSTGRDDASPERARVMAAFDVFRDVQGASAARIAQHIRDDGIDILIDLNGHTQGDNFAVLALRPAPVQAGWLGYAGTSGAPFIDACIADAVVAPNAAAFSEALARMPHCFFPTDPLAVIGAAPSRAQEGLPETGFVFASFNNSYKITPVVFALWMRLLRQVEGSVLWLRQTGPATAANLRAAAASHGVDPSRIVFTGHADAPTHLARHALADLFLDTAPYNAHATAADALWAGLPVLTRRGGAYAARVAASMLAAAGLPELITETAEEYEALALALARDPARLKTLRDKLANRATTPLFDMTAFARDIEALYRGMSA